MIPHNTLIGAEWMITTESACCLRPSGIVLNGQLFARTFCML